MWLSLALDVYGFDEAKVAATARRWKLAYKLATLTRGVMHKRPRQGATVECYGGPCDGAEVTWGEDTINLPIVVIGEFGAKSFVDEAYTKGVHPKGYATYIWKGLK